MRDILVNDFGGIDDFTVKSISLNYVMFNVSDVTHKLTRLYAVTLEHVVYVDYIVTTFSCRYSTNVVVWTDTRISTKLRTGTEIDRSRLKDGRSVRRC